MENNNIRICTQNPEVEMFQNNPIIDQVNKTKGEKTMRIYSAVTKTDHFEWNGSVWRDVVIEWQIDPVLRAFPVDLEKTVGEEWASMPKIMQTAALLDIWTYFTESEVKAFERYIHDVHGWSLEIKEIELPMQIPSRTDDTEAYCSIYEEDSYNLLFKVVGSVYGTEVSIPSLDGQESADGSGVDFLSEIDEEETPEINAGERDCALYLKEALEGSLDGLHHALLLGGAVYGYHIDQKGELLAGSNEKVRTIRALEVDIMNLIKSI